MTPPKPEPRRILAIDPSLTLTGCALLHSDPKRPLTGRLDKVWDIKPKGETLAMRLFDLHREVQSVICAARPTIVLVEMPADQKRGSRGGSFGRRSVMTLPSYGAAVGICLAATLAWQESEEASATLFPSSSDWTGGDIPSSKDDDLKEKRVAYVTRLYGLEPGVLGPKSTAGNVADATLIARWGLWRTEP